MKRKRNTNQSCETNLIQKKKKLEKKNFIDLSDDSVINILNYLTFYPHWIVMMMISKKHYIGITNAIKDRRYENLLLHLNIFSNQSLLMDKMMVLSLNTNVNYISLPRFRNNLTIESIKKLNYCLANSRAENLYYFNDLKIVENDEESISLGSHLNCAFVKNIVLLNDEVQLFSVTTINCFTNLRKIVILFKTGSTFVKYLNLFKRALETTQNKKSDEVTVEYITDVEYDSHTLNNMNQHIHQFNNYIGNYTLEYVLARTKISLHILALVKYLVGVAKCTLKADSIAFKRLLHTHNITSDNILKIIQEN